MHTIIIKRLCKKVKSNEVSKWTYYEKVLKWPKWHACKLKGVSVNLSGSRLVPNGSSVSKGYPKNEWKA